MEELFAHEMQFFQTSLSDLSSSISVASDLLKSLKQPELSNPSPTYDCIVLDGAVIVHFLATNQSY